MKRDAHCNLQGVTNTPLRLSTNPFWAFSGSTDRGSPEAGRLEGWHLQSFHYRDVPPADEDSAPENGTFHLRRRGIPQYLHSHSPPSWLVAQQTGPGEEQEMLILSKTRRGHKRRQHHELTLSICSKVDGAAMVAGASSMIFWCLLWMEQSRPNREMAFPYSSARIWTSRCLACWASCMMKIGEPGTSDWTYMQKNNQRLWGYIWYLIKVRKTNKPFHFLQIWQLKSLPSLWL